LSLFLFLFAKKDRKNQLSLETKDSQPSSKIFKLEHNSNFAHVSSCHIFHNHPEQTDPILFSELAEAKIHVLTFITWGEIQNWHLQWSRITSVGFKIDISKSPKKLGIKASRFERISTSKVFGKTGFKVALLIGFKVFLTCNLIVGQYQPSSEKGFSA